MKNTIRLFVILFFLLPSLSFAQTKDSLIVAAIISEANANSQLKNLAHELFDGIGPRLVGSPKMQQAHDWAVMKYTSWGVAARNEKWGEWRGWERGISHLDMVQPWIKTLEGTQLAWCPSTGGKSITAELIILADVADSMAFLQWLPNVRGKFVMISMMQPTGRPDYNWQEFGTKESFDKMKKERTEQTDAWRKRSQRRGCRIRTLH
jgi:carboxypeptidase Q